MFIFEEPENKVLDKIDDTLHHIAITELCKQFAIFENSCAWSDFLILSECCDFLAALPPQRKRISSWSYGIRHVLRLLFASMSFTAVDDKSCSFLKTSFCLIISISFLLFLTSSHLFCFCSFYEISPCFPLPTWCYSFHLVDIPY